MKKPKISSSLRTGGSYDWANFISSHFREPTQIAFKYYVL